MNRKLDKWTRFPTDWVRDGGLKKFSWVRHGGSGTCALMTLIALGHRLPQDGSKLVTATYDEITAAIGVSRATLSLGLNLLKELEFLDSKSLKRSTYKIDLHGDIWGKLPAQTLYGSKGIIIPFEYWKLRGADEMNALKLYIYLVAARDRDSNTIRSSYETFEKYTGVHVGHVRKALSILIHSRLLIVERQSSRYHEKKEPNIYRLVGLDDYTHFATMNAPPVTLVRPPFPIPDVDPFKDQPF
ncbi:hypothetical protein PANO111632_21075 [Paracoccus nototheniae]|uniref:Helix-turn-helix domain-containing protein n=1 Tax=Paracoccus nototheniae TaxID=2489002 RepID=A0ABW4E3Y0_9RHOB|nr:hypothetical protein [Paracoccus nototheniae]